MSTENKPDFEETTEPPKKAVEIKSIVPMKNDGLDLSTFEAQSKYASTLMKQKIISSTFKDPMQVVIGMEYCRAMNLPYIVGLSSMYIIRGRPALYGDVPLALVKKSGLLESIDEFYIDKDFLRICVKNKNINTVPYAAVIRTKRKGDEIVQEDYFTQDDIAKSGVDKDKFGKKDTYKKWERIMMRYRARSLNLKTKFADLIQGMDLAEHVSFDLPKDGVFEADFKTNRNDELTDQITEGKSNGEKSDNQS